MIKMKSPGMLPKHYSPKLPLRTNVITAKKGEVLIGFGDNSKASINLSPTANLEEAARNLYETLRRLDNDIKFSGIAINPIPNEGIGVAINDRLSRASQS